MPVSTSHGATRAKRCKHCEEGHQPSDSSSLLWRIHLDQDLLDTIVSIYPSWFKDVRPPDGMATPHAPPTSAQRSSNSSSSSSQNIPPPPPLLPPPLSPPKAEVDESPLQKSMDKNKESLKVKLMLRRPINQLVAQGIMPPLKTPPAFHAQRRQLERAKTGDLLRAKIQARPARTELVRQHILLGGEDGVGPVDPSLAEKQRRLSKCRLADQLNDQLAHRPGPLELIKKNILHTEEPIERAVKEGVIAFRATCEGQTSRPDLPDHYMTLDDDSRSSSSPPSLCGEPNHSPPSLSSEGGGLATSPPSLFSSSSPHSLCGEERERGIVGSDMLETAAANAGIVTVMAVPLSGAATLLSPISLGSTTSSLSPLSSISSPPSSSSSASSSLSRLQQQQQPAPGKDKNSHRKKSSKSKSSAPKTRTIKFHEYKGPPNAQKNSSGSVSGAGPSSSGQSPSPVETSYELLLQQQQLLWQLEWQHKYPQIILPASQKPMGAPLLPPPQASPSPGPPSTPSSSSSSSMLVHSPSAAAPAPPSSSSSVPTAAAVAPPPPPPPLPPLPPTPVAHPSSFTTTTPLTPDTRPLRNLEDMKVCDLKAELKKRSLPVSGPKPQLIERLKPFTEKSQLQAAAAAISVITIPSSSSSDDSLPASNVSSPAQSYSQPMSTGPPEPPSPPPSPPGAPAAPPCCSPPLEGQESLSEDIIRQQQRRIEMLQRQLITSQLQLQHQQNTFQPHPAPPSSSSPRPPSTPPAVNAKASLAAFLQQQQLNQLLAQQQIIINNNNNNNNNNVNNNVNSLDENRLKKTIIIGTQPATILFNHINLHKVSSSGSPPTSTSTSQSLPNFLGTFVTPSHQILLPSSAVLTAATGNINGGQGTIRLSGINGGDGSLLSGNGTLLNSNGTLVNSNGTLLNSNGSLLNGGEGGGGEMLEEDFQLSPADMMDMLDSKPPPPQYEVAAKYLKSKQQAQESRPPAPSSKGGGDLKVKSQLLDDIIDILIQNGDMSPSAADPNTPPALDKTTAPPPAPPAGPFSLSATGPPAPPSDEEPHAIDYHSLGLDMEQFPMDLGDDVTSSSHHNTGVTSSHDEVELMDVDTDWLERFISDDPILSPAPQPSVLSNGGGVLSNTNGVLSNEYDPLLSNNSSFWNELLLGNGGDTGSGGDYKMLNEQELFCGGGGWDRIDYAS